MEEIGLFETPGVWNTVQEESKGISESVRKISPLQKLNTQRITLYQAIQNIGEKGGDPFEALQALVLYKHYLLAMKELYPNSDLVKGWVNPELAKIKDKAHGYMDALLTEMKSVGYKSQMARGASKANARKQDENYQEMGRAIKKTKELAPRITYIA